MAGRASIVGAAATHVGKVREHNEDSHVLDLDAGLFVVCDGMGGHAAGEVASALAVQAIRRRWVDEATRSLVEAWLRLGTPDAKKRLFGALRDGVLAAHEQILAEGAEDSAKSGMGTTLVGALVVGDELVFAHAGDSRAYLVRDGIAMQLTEDHTLLARLLAAGIDVDVSGEGGRFRSMLTNALGIGQACKVSTFVVPLADGDRFLLCSDGISEYVPEAEVGTVLTKQASPQRAASRLVELALERGGGDNATALVVRVLEAGESPHPAEHRRRDDAVIEQCPLWGGKLTPQQRLRALRIAIARDHAAGARLPAMTLGDRVAWIILEGSLVQHGKPLGPGALLYADSLVGEGPPPERSALALALGEVRALALRADDFRELCDDDLELGEVLLETLGTLVSSKRRGRTTQSEITAVQPAPRRAHSNSDIIEPPPPVLPPLPITMRAPDAAPRTTPPHPPPRRGRPSTPEPISPSLAPAGTPQRGSLIPPPPPVIREPSEPEIEAYYELDAEPPPLREPGAAEDTADPFTEVMLSVEGERRSRVIEKVTETAEATLTLTVTEPDEDVRPRSITAEHAATVSGTISVPDAPEDADEDSPPPRRAKRVSEGWDD